MHDLNAVLCVHSQPPLPLAQLRQLESLVRLAEARAKADLSAVVTAEHAQVTFFHSGTGTAYLAETAPQKQAAKCRASVRNRESWS